MSNQTACQAMFRKFALALLGVAADRSNFMTTQEFVLDADGGLKKSPYICAPHAAAGMGMLLAIVTRVPSCGQ